MSPRCSACGVTIAGASGHEAQISAGLGDRLMFRLCTTCDGRVDRQWREGRTPDLVFKHMEAAAQHLAIAAHVAGLAEGDWVLGELQQQLQDASDDVIRTFNLAKQVPELRQLSDDQDDD